MAKRRSGATRSSRNRPAPRSACAGRKPESSVRLSASTAAVRARHVAAPGPVVGGKHVAGAGIGEQAGEHVGERGHVAIAEIEALRADRREEVGGLAGKHHAVRRRSAARSCRKAETSGACRRWRWRRAPTARAPRSRRRAPPRRAPSRRSVSAGRSTQTRLERLPGSGTSVNGPASVWNSVEVSSCGIVWRRLQTSAA